MGNATDAAAGAQVAAGAASDALGSFGVGLTAYHVGDLTGLVGLVLTLYGLWWTYREAKQAKRASEQAKTAAEQARQAAQDALRRRDAFEVVAQLTELVGKLHDLRNATQQDDWSSIDHRFNAAVSIAVKLLGASMLLTPDEQRFTGEIHSTLRMTQKKVQGVKDATKLGRMKASLGVELLVMIDTVEVAQIRRTKDAT